MGQRIGFVEDSDEDFALFARVFSRDWELERWPTGEAAVQAFGAVDPRVLGVRVLLVDHDLPGIDGVRVIERIRACPGGDLPLVCMVSGSGRTEIPQRALAAGADAFIAKPEDIAGLRDLAARVAQMAGARA